MFGYLTFSAPKQFAGKTIQLPVVRLYSGNSVDESKALGRTEFIANKLNAGNHYFKMRLTISPTT